MKINLGEVCTARSSLVDPTADEYRDLPHIAPDSIERDSGRLLDFRSASEDGVTSGKYRFDTGDVLYSKIRPYLNKVAVADFPGLCSADMYALVVDPKRATPQFVTRVLRSRDFLDYSDSLSNRANIPKLNRKQLMQYEFELPPLEEQQRIAGILDQSDAIRAKRRQVVAYLDWLPQSIFHEMFGDPAVNGHGWQLKSLGELAVKFGDGPFGSNLKSSHYVPFGVRIVRLQNIGIGRFVDDNAAYITPEHFAFLAKHRCLPGDVLIGTLGDPNLRACVQPSTLPEALNKADCVQMRVNATIAHQEWVCWLLNMPGTLALAKSMMHGQTRTRVSMGQLRGLKIPVPPLELQREFAARVEWVNAQRALVRRASDADNELFASLQARAFRGEL